MMGDEGGDPAMMMGANMSMEKMMTTEQTSIATTEEPMTWDDATWILTSSFIIFTMQSGKSGKG